jgi:deoxyribodipyrimidine photo-lyase
MTLDRWLFWHRRDLRLTDNLGLALAADHTPAVTGVYVLDPALLHADDQAPARLWFLRDSLAELQERWRAAGSRLLLLQGDPAELLPRLATALTAATVAWNREVEPLSRDRDRRVAAALGKVGVRVQADWDQLLVAPESLRTGAGDPYRVYGPFLRNWRSQLERKAPLGAASTGGLAPVAAPSGLLDLTLDALPAERRPQWEALPLLAALPATLTAEGAFAGADLCPCRPGEAAALAQLMAFTDASGPLAKGQGIPLLAYEPGRNLPGDAGTSALSAALTFGTISPRQCWAAAQVARHQARGT